MQALQIGAVICSFLSLLLLLISLGSDYWILASDGHLGLWKVCTNIGCASFGMDVVGAYHATRAFLLLGMIAGAVVLLGLCLMFSSFQLGSVSLPQAAATTSFAAGVFTLIAMATFTGHFGSHISYGWSFALGWVSFPLFLITGGLAYALQRTAPA